METGNIQEQAQALDYSFIEYEALDKLRADQQAQLNSAGAVAVAELSYKEAFISGDEALTAAEKQLAPELDHKIELLVDSHLSKTEQAEQYNKVFALIRTISAHNMDDAKWYNGEIGADGNYDYTTSGRYLAKQIILELKAHQPVVAEETETSEDDQESEDPDLVDHNSPEVVTAYRELETTINNLAELSVARRKLMRRNHGKVPADLEAKYNQAHAAHQAAIKKTTDLFIAGGRTQGISDQKIYEKVAPKMIKFAHTDLTTAEFKLLTSDDSFRAKAARFFAKRGTLLGLSIGSGIGIGLGVRALSKSAVAAGAGITGGAAVGAALAIRTTRNVLTAKLRNNVMLNKEFQQRQAADAKTLSAFETKAAANPDAKLALYAVGSKIGEVITKRVETDVRNNKRRAIFAAAAGGLAAAAVEFGPDLWHALEGNTHPTSDTVTIPPHVTPAAPAVEVPTPTATQIVDGLNLDNQPPIVIGGGNTIGSLDPNVYVEHGHGIIREIRDTTGLSGADATKAYHAVLQSQGSQFFNSIPVVPHGADEWISHSGYTAWDRNHEAALYNWMLENDKVAA